MGKNYIEIWESCLRTIKKHIPTQSYATWFAPIKPVKVEADALTVLVPNKFFYEFLEENYVTVLSMALKQELGTNAKLEYQITLPGPQGAGYNVPQRRAVSGGINNSKAGLRMPAHVRQQEEQAQGFAKNNMIDAKKITNPFVIPGIQKIKIDSQLKTHLRFENFIEGDCNRLARSAGIALSQNPGNTGFNPLIIFGDVGLGKTHLAQAIGNEILSSDPNKRALYVTSDQFANQVVQSIKNNAVSDLLNFYNLLDVMIVDDIQFFGNKSKTQEIFFHIFNHLHQNNRQIIMTSDKAPKDLNGLEDRLISRFKWGLSADLQVPDYETRLAILEQKVALNGITIKPNILEYISQNITNNIRELEGVINTLLIHHRVNPNGINLETAKSVINKFVNDTEKEISPEFILDVVADHFGLTPEALSGKKRKREIVIARQMAMYFIKELTNASLKSIGEALGGRDHSTVIYSIRTVRDLYETDHTYREDLEKVEKQIKKLLRQG